MKKLLQAAGVAGLVLFGAVGCSTCCGSKTTTSASPCANGQCGTPTTVITPGTPGTAMPTTMTTMPGKPPMLSVNQMPATGGTMPTGTTVSSPALLPQN